MADKLRKENDKLQKEISEVRKELAAVRNSIGKEQHGASASRKSSKTPPNSFGSSDPVKPSETDFQYLSDSYDDILVRLSRLELRVNEIANTANTVAKAIDDFQLYSYQYNLKLVGVPQQEGETAEDTVNLCLKIFSGISAEVSEWDIDTAHRVPFRSETQNGRRRQASSPQPIICKFVRRIARDRVIAKRREVRRLTPVTFNLPPDEEDLNITIYSHLTPRLQELLRNAKTFQQDHGYKYCWAKDTAVFLRQADGSRVHRLNTSEDLECLRVRGSTDPTT